MDYYASEGKRREITIKSSYDKYNNGRIRGGVRRPGLACKTGVAIARAMCFKRAESFSDVFAVNPKAPSITSITEHAINTGSALPVKARGMRMSPKSEKEVETQLDQMLINGIVRPSCSPWAARVILIEKKDKSLRFAVDYRGLKDVTRKDAYTIPDIRDILDKLHGNSIFSKLDGDSAYWSVPIRDEDIPKTAFTYNPTRTIRVFCYVIWFNLRTCNVSEDY